MDMGITNIKQHFFGVLYLCDAPRIIDHEVKLHSKHSTDANLQDVSLLIHDHVVHKQ